MQLSSLIDNGSINTFGYKQQCLRKTEKCFFRSKMATDSPIWKKMWKNFRIGHYGRAVVSTDASRQ